MPIDDQQRLDRRNHIGASDMAAILGVDPWRNAADVWAEKTGRLDLNAGSEVMEAGNRFESGVLDWISDRVGPLVRNVHLAVPDLHLASNLDAQVCADGRPVEAKTAGLFGPLAEEWGDDGTDDIPSRVIVQVTVQMRCIKTPVSDGVVAAFIGGRGFAEFTVPWNGELVRMIEDAAIGFWRYVETDTMPPNLTPSLSTLKKMKRTPTSVVPVAPALLEAYRCASETAKKANESKARAEAELLAALGDADGVNAGDSGSFTYMMEKRRGYTVAPSEHRQLRFRKGTL